MRRFRAEILAVLAIASTLAACGKKTPPAVEDAHATCDRFAHQAMGRTAAALVLAMGDDAKEKDCFRAHADRVSECMTPAEAKDFEAKTAELTAQCQSWSAETIACIRDDSTSARCATLLEAAMGHEEATEPTAPAGPPVKWSASLSAIPMDVAVVDDVVVAVLRDGVIGVGRIDGETRWTLPFAAALTSMTESWVVPLGKGLALVGDGHGAAIAIDLATGKESWRVLPSPEPEEPHDPILAAATVSEGKVRMLMEKGSMVTLTREACGGAKKAAKKCVEPWAKIPMIVVGQMIVDPKDGRTWIHGNEDVYVLSSDGALEAHFRTGEGGGVGDIGVLGDGHVAFVVDESRLVVASAESCKPAANAVIRLSPKATTDDDETLVPAPNGCIAATKKVHDGFSEAPRAMDGGGVLVAAEFDRIVRFDGGDDPTWRAGTGAIRFDADAKTGDVVLFAGRGDGPSVVEGYDRNGKIRWRTSVGFGDGDRNDSFLVRDGDGWIVADKSHLARLAP